jgi:hypothetical protein
MKGIGYSGIAVNQIVLPSLSFLNIGYSINNRSYYIRIAPQILQKMNGSTPA